MKNLCENRLCIHFEDGKCTLNSVSLDELGFCSNMFQVNIKEEYLEFKRKKLLKKFQQLDHN